ncbi:hypothetical protein CPB83DRAFT_216727 [Crepidotus variabilis]|uniref:Uncharacterized protein n=1 Tax=Crepidotus variabilis TaxID=179855 RepID=A0A9P6ETW0_9AGAR|nr:hypothetical protein CPB83DRAFT_216727 [Crepidotus variabilis]
MMKTPKGKTPVLTFCVKCSKEQFKAAAQPPVEDVPIPSNASTESQPSRSSTPPTEVSAAPSSPTFELPPETETTRRRREQSDRASAELGKKLLQGWAMLGDECPNNECYGIPLVRPPKLGGQVNPRKICVICGSTYETEKDWAGSEILVPFDPKSDLSQQQPSSKLANRIPIAGAPLTVEQNPLVLHTASSSKQSIPTQLITNNLDDTTKALQHSLVALSTQITSLSSQSHIDATAIGSTADAISKVSQALIQVRLLQRSEV